MNPVRNRSSIIYLLLVVAIIVLVVFNFQQQGNSQESLTINEVAMQVQQSQVARITEDDNRLLVVYKDGDTEAVSYKAPETTLVEQLMQLGVTSEQMEPEKIKIEIKPPSPWLGIATIFSYVMPFLLLGGVFWFVFRQAQGSNNAAMSFGKSRARMSGDQPTVTFEDVAGVEEAKEELLEVVEFLREPEKFIALGARIPKGVLLVGAPGTGKTLMAKAVSGEAGVPFFSISGSEFVEMFVGVGASRVRDLFAQAKKEAPSIIFIDEIDAIGKSRASGGQMGGNDEREQTLNQLLAEMDGFGTDTPVIVLAATNRPEILDAALLRAGRFDRQVLVDKPDFDGRLAILKVHSKGVKLSSKVDLTIVAKQTAGLAGADLANIINEAALLAGRFNKKEIEQSDLLESIERSFVGLEKKNRKISEVEKRIVAYHESGHALMAELTKGATRVTKVSIIPRGLGALGYTLHLPDDEDRFLKQKHELMAEIDVLLGGRAAEEVFIGEISTGAGNDLDRATAILKDMVSVYGMSDIAGLMVLKRTENSFLGGGMASTDYSEKMAEDIDHHIKTTLNERYAFVKKTLNEYHQAIENMTAVLLDIEVIEGKKVRSIIADYEKENNMKSRLAHGDKIAKAEAFAKEQALKNQEDNEEI